MLTAPLDSLSPLARSVLKMNVNEAYTHLTPSGDGLAEALEALKNATPEQMLAKTPAQIDEAAGMLAGLYLWHDWLDESHKVSQSLHTTSGSMWHAIMHRREGDFSNSKYWYAKCENHPVLPTLAMQANEAINPYPADVSILKLTHHGWDSDAFVDLVERVHEKPSDPRYKLAVALQQLEWRLLFDHCTRAAATESEPA
jgi:hypothetical protein